MIAFLKQFTAPKSAPEYRDSLLGVLVSKNEGEWRGEIPFRNFHTKLVLPGATYQPSSTRVALARTLLPNLPSKVDLAMDYAASVNPDLWLGRLMFAAVNLFYQTTTDSYALDFTVAGDLSGRRWQVRFEGGKPVQLEYC